MLRKIIHNVKNNYDVCQKYFCRGKIIYVQTYIELCFSIINYAESKIIMPRHKCHIDDTNEPPYITNLERSQNEPLTLNYESSLTCHIPQSDGGTIKRCLSVLKSKFTSYEVLIVRAKDLSCNAIISIPYLSLILTRRTRRSPLCTPICTTNGRNK